MLILKYAKHTIFGPIVSALSDTSNQPTLNPNLESYIEGTLEELSRIEIKHVQSNITKAERIALTGLGNRQDIVIKPFDKGRGICVLNKQDYINEGEGNPLN